MMTGLELLRLQSVLHGISRHEVQARSDYLLERVGLTNAGSRRVGTYSGGMRRRLDLALALVHEPVVLFLDEPTTGLDPTSRQAVWDEVRALNDSGTTVFLTTQYLEEADQLADRVAIIDGGLIVREGTPSALKAAVGTPTLRVDVDPADNAEAKRLLESFGESRPSRPGRVSIGLRDGVKAVAEVVRQLDDAKIALHHLELDEPSLDDVFAEATGRRLEGAGSSATQP
jgi:ABC-2 type transport system ATP-binding protein